MTRDEWETNCAQVVNAMLEHVKPFSTPISIVIDHENGEHLGSGSFVTDGRNTYLITNEHVARELKSTSLAHLLHDSGCAVRIMNPFFAKEYPVDVAVTKINEQAWSSCQHNSQPIPINRFSSSHDLVDGEIMFMIGYTGERAGFHFGTLCSPGTPYLTQAVEFPSDIGNIEYHFSICYKPDLAVSVDGNTRGLPKPPGMSGSLVWN